jgi:hypothetical protein
MFKRLLAIAVFCGVATTGLASNGRPVNLVTLFLAPPYTDHEGLRQLATQYDAVILHEWSADKLPELRAANPQIICLLYKNGMGLHMRNNVESVDVYANHGNDPTEADWFQTDSSGQRITWDYNADGIMDYYACRPDNTDWQQYWAEEALQAVISEGWDGVFADDLWTYTGVYGAPAGYPSNAALEDAVTTFLTAQNKAFRSHGLYLTGNIGWWRVDDRLVWRDYMSQMDAGCQEKFSPDEVHLWLNQMADLAQAMAERRHVILIRWGYHDDLRRALYSYCNALLITDGRRVWYGYLNPNDPSGMPPYYPWYDRSTDLGRPVGTYVIDYDNRISYRAYEHGWVYVNPDVKARTVTLPTGTTWYNRDGQPVTTLSLSPYTGDFVCDRP